jgi:hypothetical protein
VCFSKCRKSYSLLYTLRNKRESYVHRDVYFIVTCFFNEAQVCSSMLAILEPYFSLRRNLKSETLISDAWIGARLKSGKVRRARVGVAQTWVEDELYGDTRVVEESPFCNYRSAP